jgi:hypothetical protein
VKQQHPSLRKHVAEQVRLPVNSRNCVLHGEPLHVDLFELQFLVLTMALPGIYVQQALTALSNAAC